LSARGPVAILQSSWMCVLIAPNTDPQILHLHMVTDDWLRTSANTLRKSSTRDFSGVDGRGARKRPVNESAAKSSVEYNVLAEIWGRILNPLINALGWKVSRRLSRSWVRRLIFVPETGRE
jgi:hypothetical protein